MPPIEFNMPTTIRSHVVVFIIGLIIGLLTCNTCKRVPACPEKDSVKTVVVYDTIYIADTLRMLWQRPIPIESFNANIKIKRIFDTLYVEKYSDREDGKALLLEYTIDSLTRLFFATHKYSDTLKLKYGYVVANETVTQNGIFNKEMIPYLQIPEVTHTITNTIKEKKRNLLYFGLRGGYQFHDATYVGAALKFKLKSDVQFGFNANINTFGKSSAGLEFDLPIKLRKQK